MNCGVYKIENMSNGKVYIGSSIDLNTRFKNHKWKLRNDCHRNPHLQNSWNKSGEDNFRFEVILYCDKSDLLFYEQKAINSYDACNRDKGYNLIKEAERREHDEETIKKMKGERPSLQGENHPFYGVQGEDHPWYGEEHTEEEKKKMEGDRPSVKGENNPASSITKDEAREIKKLWRDTDLIGKDIAKRFDTSLNVVYRIKNEETWSHITI